MINIKKEYHPKIVSVGSCSIDELLELPHLPTHDETILAKGTGFMYGGKGSNQAFASARLGAKSYFVGAVGMDPHGQQVLRHMKDDEVNIGFVSEQMDFPTGTAFILDSESGRAVLISPGANEAVTPKLIREFDKAFHEADFILTQPEILNETVSLVYDLAVNQKIPFGFYASPADEYSSKYIEHSRFFLVKEKDLPKVFSHMPAEELLKKYPENLIIISSGYKKKYANAAGEIISIQDDFCPQFPLGMGDAFAAGMAFSLAHGNSFYNSAVFAHEVSKMASRSRGSQKSLPYLKELQSHFSFI